MALFSNDGDDVKIVDTKSFFSIEEELEEEYEDTPLTWRGSPTDTFSDCTLVVSNKEEVGSDSTFHVHRAVLGASDKRCLYFMKASQKNQNNVDIALDFKAAQDAFPVMLDFVYFGKLDIDTANSEALRHLADVLQCRPLRLAVNKFIEGDFNVNTCIHYVSETHKFNDKQLLNVAVRESAKMFGDIDIDSFTRLEPELFYAIVSNQYFACKDGDRLSKTILRYFDKKPEKLSSTLLVKLTHAIPTIRQEEAIAFLQVLEKVDADEDEESWKALTPLCIRCSEAVAPITWSDDISKAQDEFFFEGKWSGDGPSRVFVTRLVASLKYAQDQCLVQQKAIEDVQVHATHSMTENQELRKLLDEAKKATAEAIAAAAVEKEESRNQQEDEQRDDPNSPAYRDLAMNLSSKLNDKDQYIVELENELEKKEIELDKVGQMMVHLNARLKFYEILHNETKSPQPTSPSSRTSSKSRTSSPSRKSASPGRRMASAPSTPTRTITPRGKPVKRMTPTRPETPLRPPASPRFTFRHALNE